MSNDLARELLALHAPRPLGPQSGDVQQCGHCADLCHSRSGLGCEMEGDALYPCATAQIVSAAFPGLYVEVDKP